MKPSMKRYHGVRGIVINAFMTHGEGQKHFKDSSEVLIKIKQ
jgi:hypothetical protein